LFLNELKNLKNLNLAGIIKEENSDDVTALLKMLNSLDLKLEVLSIAENKGINSPAAIDELKKLILN
jgi:hypothetical protein